MQIARQLSEVWKKQQGVLFYETPCNLYLTIKTVSSRTRQIPSFGGRPTHKTMHPKLSPFFSFLFH